ncbi:GGDEF domain-containing protein [Spongiibacter marinus]|uniref:GGDEF domain-containing protein n=1 Tax=Spongiibacter marinus TaxID=354246 RepID=UPI00356598D5
MTLTQKATLIIASTMLFTIFSGLLARELILNPHLKKIENAADLRDVDRFEQAVKRYRDNLEGRVSRIYAAAGLLQSLETQLDWSPIILQLAHIGGYGELDYFILADETGHNRIVKAGEIAEKTRRLPSNKTQTEIVQEALSRLDKESNTRTSGLMLSQEDGPLVYAAGKANWTTDKLPSIYIAVRRIDDALIASLGERLGLTVNAMTHDESIKQRELYGIGLGQRSEDDTLYSLLRNDAGEVIIHMRFKTAPRAFDDEIFSPTIVAALMIAMLSWAVVMVLMRRSIIYPIENLAQTMRRIRQSSNYQQKLSYKHNDELGKLVDEYNELLEHVANHTSKLEAYSYKDALTGIGNRRLFQERLDYLWKLASRRQLSLSAIVFDLDYFKQYNDRYGHDGGDHVLRQFADLLKKRFTRETDVIARTGGEEFIVLLFDVSKANALKLANRLVGDLRLLAIPHEASPQSGVVSVSAGVASFTPIKDNSPDELIRKADEALYEAKAAGRDQVSISADAHT